MAEERLTGGKRKGLPRGIGWAVFAVAVLFVVGLVISFRLTQERILRSATKNLEQFQAGVDALKKFDARSAEEKFSAIGEAKNPEQTMENFWSLFGGAKEIFSGFRNISTQAVVLSQELDFFKRDAAGLFLNRGGSVLLEHLKSARSALQIINEESRKFSSLSSVIPRSASVKSFPEFYLPLALDAERVKSLLDTAISWLGSERKILVFLQNPSEIRPAGGFLGSYAILSIANGELEQIEVRDINEVDRTFDKKIIPPKALQSAVKSWRPADANWFFDFSLSAEKTMEFFEASGLYKGEKFDGAAAISPKIAQDILAIVGPIEIPKKKLVLNRDNFLVETQRVVQEGQAAGATYPKKVLEELAPLLVAKTASLGDKDKDKIWDLVANWVQNKDVVLYFRDEKLENLADYYGAAGKLYELPTGFNGDYLAIVDASVGGGKSDLFVKQAVSLESQINSDGTASNHLVIERVHQGSKSKYWWYKTPNQDYLQIYVPRGAVLTNFSGGFEKKIAAPIDFARTGYQTDSLLASAESSTEKVFSYPAVETRLEGGKRIFSTWSQVKSGEKTKISFDYANRSAFIPEDGAKYEFVFEKQAGTNRGYKFQISAPVGFVFKENGLPVWTYETDDIPGRLVVDLTLERI